MLQFRVWKGRVVLMANGSGPCRSLVVDLVGLLANRGCSVVIAVFDRPTQPDAQPPPNCTIVNHTEHLPNANSVQVNNIVCSVVDRFAENSKCCW